MFIDIDSQVAAIAQGIRLHNAVLSSYPMRTINAFPICCQIFYDNCNCIDNGTNINKKRFGQYLKNKTTVIPRSAWPLAVDQNNIQIDGCCLR